MELVTAQPTTATADHLDLLMDPPRVSAYLGVPVGTLANWRYKGLGPAFIKMGRHVRYRSEDVARWVEDQLDRTRPARRATSRLRQLGAK